MINFSDLFDRIKFQLRFLELAFENPNAILFRKSFKIILILNYKSEYTHLAIRDIKDIENIMQRESYRLYKQIPRDSEVKQYVLRKYSKYKHKIYWMSNSVLYEFVFCKKNEYNHLEKYFEYL